MGFLSLVQFLVLVLPYSIALAEPPHKYSELVQLSSKSHQQTMDQLNTLRTSETDPVSLLWLSVIEAKALYHMNRFSESQSVLINVESAAELVNDQSLNEMTMRLMGQNFYRMAGFDQAMSYALKAQLIAEKNDLLWEKAQTTNLIAAIHLRSGELSLALSHFEQALAYFVSTDAKIDVAKLKNNLGAVYIETKSYDLAEKYLREALSLAFEINRPTTIISALVNQIELNVGLNDYKQASKVYQECLDFASNEDLSSFEVWCLEAGAEMYLRQGLYEQAIEVATQAYQLASDQQLHQSQINLGKVLVDLYAKTQQYQLALSVSSLNLSQVESIKDEVLKLKLDEVSALNDVERTRSQLMFERERNELLLKNQRLTWIGIAILVPVLLIALLLLRSKQRLFKALHAQQVETKDALRMMREAKEMNEKLAKTDALTGLYNRREMTRRIEDICLNPFEENSAYVMMLDVDYFKKINDSLGHAVGDQVLIELSQKLVEMMPEQATCARWGGEEFVVLLEGLSSGEAAGFAQKFINHMAANKMAGDHVVEVTVSIGLSEKTNQQKMDDWIQQADLALYQSKNNGRNQLTVYQQ